MKQLTRISIISVVACTVLFGCASHQVKSTNTTPVIAEQALLTESELLDVAIFKFDPGDIDEQEDEKSPLFFAEIRNAESQYFPFLLMQALQKSAAWGPVRIVPRGSIPLDVNVEAKVVSSDGEQLKLWVKAFDASGKTWFEKEYIGMASRYAYDPKARRSIEPFADVYHRIANDLMQYKKVLNEQNIIRLQNLSELRFAADFSPETFDSYIDKNEAGQLKLNGLPAEQDPMLQRIRTIRERDQMYIDTLQEHYSQFAREMAPAYFAWRGQSYQEVIAMRELEESSRNRTILGAAAIVGGILGAGSSSAVARAAGHVGIAGGGYMIKSGLDRGDQVQIHVEALLELGESLEASIAPQVIELEDRTITLQGTVEDQYQQWKQLLKEIYQLERGNVVGQQ